MATIMKAHGVKLYLMGKVLHSLRMDLNTQANLSKVKEVDLV